MARTRWLLLTCALLVTISLASWRISESVRRSRLNQALATAVSQNDIAATEDALLQGADPNTMRSDWQVMWNSVDQKVFLNPLQWPALVDLARRRRFRSYPPLFFAKDPAMVRLLVAHGADPNGTGGGTYRTALMRAAWRGEPALVRALVAAGADVNQRDKSGFTALLSATADLKYGVLPGAEGPYGQVVRILLDSGADVNARHPKGKTALAMAERSPHAKIVRVLRNAGAKR